MRLALDTNVMAYAEGLNGPSMRKAALELLQGLPEPPLSCLYRRLVNSFRFLSARLVVHERVLALRS